MLKRARYEEESFLFCLSFLLLCEYIFSLLSSKNCIYFRVSVSSLPFMCPFL